MAIAVVPGHPSGQAGILQALKVYARSNEQERYVFFYESLLPDVQEFAQTHGDLHELTLDRDASNAQEYSSRFSQRDIGVLVTGTRNRAPWHEREARISAREHCVKSVHFNATWSDLDKISGEQQDMPTVLTVIDEYARDVAVQTGFDAARIRIVGNPMYDDLPEIRAEFVADEHKNRIGVRDSLGIPHGAYVLLVFTQPHTIDGVSFGYDEVTFLNDLVSEVHRVDADVTFCVSHHPRNADPVKGNAAQLEQIVRSSGRPVVVPPWAKDIRSAYSMILASDIVVSMESTMLVIAAHLGKPAVSSQPGLAIPDRLATNAMGVTIPVYVPRRVGDVIDTIRKDSGAVSTLAPNLSKFGTDGKAAERLAAVFSEYYALE